MFAVTFLGHQGWMVSAQQTSILIDPLLVEPFGHAGAVGTVFPPRRIDFASFPPIDAVLLTHEHEDHFNVPSLNRIDRSVPIYLSSRSSEAARTILREMGFRVHLPGGGDEITVGSLKMTMFTPDYVNGPFGADEWDVLQFLITDVAGEGSFFSSVDLPHTLKTEETLRRLLPKPGLFCHTNNSLDWSVLQTGKILLESEPFDTLKLSEHVTNEQARLRHHWGAPAGTLMCGGGWSFCGEREWMNHHVFHADSKAICGALQMLRPDELFLAPDPGQTVRMKRGAVSEVVREEFLTTLPTPQWPSRAYRPTVEMIGDYGPASGRREMGREDLLALEGNLAEFAQHLYGRREFRGLLSLERRECEPREPTIAFVLLDEGQALPLVFAYNSSSCTFRRRAAEAPAEEFVAGVECWASDLLWLFEGRLSPAAVVQGRGWSWNYCPTKLRLSVGWIWDFFHPLRRPRQFLELYRRLLAGEAVDVPRIRQRTETFA